MADVEDNKDERATMLAARAVELVAAGKAEEGSRALREASSLAPENPQVKAAFQNIQRDDQQHIIRKLCSKFAHENDEEAGQEALQYLARSAEVPSDIARQCVGLMLDDNKGKNAVIRDGVLAGLLRESPAAKVALAKRLQGSDGGRGTTVAFEHIYNVGDGSASGITAVVLDSSAWSTEAVREACEQDVFQLYLAKLMEVGDDHNGRAMKGIARLLAADAPKLHTLMDEETVNMILSTLDFRNSTEIKSQGTLAIAKYLEASESKGQYALTKYVTTKIAQQKNVDLVLAFSAAAAVFPVAPSMASSLFLVEGFVSSLPPLLEKKAKSEKVEHAALEMLSAACVDGTCREAISKHCTAWLQQTMKAEKGERSVLAAIILAKLSGPSGQTKGAQDGKDLDDLVLRLQNVFVRDSLTERQGSIEGLAYASIQPKIKLQLATNKSFLQSLLECLREYKEGSSIAFGCLTVLNNLTRYPPNLSKEQKRMTHLKAYANAAVNSSKGPIETDPLDQEPAINSRCKAVLDAGAVPVLVRIGKLLSPASISLLFNILLSLAWPQPHRGLIAQQGGVRLLLQLYTKITDTSSESIRARQTAAHAVARILTSVDPKLVFPGSGTPNETSAVRPLISLLIEDPFLVTDGPRDLLPTFEALLALTNLLVDSYGETVGSTGNLIARLVQPALDEVMLHKNIRIRRAATQLAPNLVQHSAGIALFADESNDAAARRLYWLLAFSGDDDLEIRKAAGGALAVLCGYEGTIKSILGMERGIDLLLAMLDDDDDDVVHRGIYAVAGTVSTEGDTGKVAKAKMKALGLEDKLKIIIETPLSEENAEMAATALIALNDS